MSIERERRMSANSHLVPVGGAAGFNTTSEHNMFLTDLPSAIGRIALFVGTIRGLRGK